MSRDSLENREVVEAEVVPLRKSGSGVRRSATISAKKLSEDEITIFKNALMAKLDDDMIYHKPKIRGDCKDAPRPCPFVSCKHHLYLDVNPDTGSIKLNFPNTPVWEMEESCTLDIADNGGITLEKVGDLLNLNRERIRQVESIGPDKLRERDMENFYND